MADTFLQVKTWVANRANRSLTAEDTYIGDAVVSAIQFFEQEQFPFLQASTSLTLLSGANSVALPSDFGTLVNLRLLDDTTLYNDRNGGFRQCTYEELQDKKELSPNTSYRPNWWALYGSTIYVERPANQNYTLELDYNKQDSSYPSADADTSVFFGDQGRDLVRYRALEFYYRDRLKGFEQAERYRIMADRKVLQLRIKHNKRYGNNLRLQ